MYVHDMYVWGAHATVHVWWSKDNFVGSQSVNQVARLLRQILLLAELSHWSYTPDTLFLILLKIIFEKFEILDLVFVFINIKNKLSSKKCIYLK